MKKLAVFFPGVGYHCDKPLLYYGRDIAFECGYEEYINLSYSCDTAGMRGNAEKIAVAAETLYAQAAERLAEVDFSQYDDILFISKSIGTAIAAAYAQRNGLTCRNVFYTPLEQTFLFEPKDGIAFTGTADPWVAHEKIVEGAANSNLPLYIYDNVNHSLENPNNTLANLELIQDVMRKTKEYILGK